MLMWAERSQFKTSDRLRRERPVSMIAHSGEPRLMSRGNDMSQEGLLRFEEQYEAWDWRSEI